MEGHRITASDRDAGAGNIFVAKINLSRFLHSMTAQQIGWFKAGSALNALG
jgi:hypothetical protein